MVRVFVRSFIILETWSFILESIHVSIIINIIVTINFVISFRVKVITNLRYLIGMEIENSIENLQNTEGS